MKRLEREGVTSRVGEKIVMKEVNDLESGRYLGTDSEQRGNESRPQLKE